MGNKRSFETLSEDKFVEIYQAFWERLYCVGYHHLRDQALVQEIVKDVFVMLWLNRSEVSRVEDTEAYLLIALKSKIYDHFGHVAVKKEHLELVLEDFS